MLISSWRFLCYIFYRCYTIVEKQPTAEHKITNIVENIKTAGEGKLQSFSNVVDGEITAAIGDHTDGKQELALHLF